MDLKNKNGDVVFTSESFNVADTLVSAARSKYNFDFSQVVLNGVSINGNTLKDVNLRGITITNSYINGKLESINFTNATLTGTKFSSATLEKVRFEGAKLGKTNFEDAVLDLRTLSTIPSRYIASISTLASAEARTSFIPKEGSFLGYKKLRYGRIATLEIGPKAKRSHGANGPTERKCRCSSAKVISIVDKAGKKVKEGVSDWDPSFKYTVGKTVKPRHPFDDNRWNICTSGIHFFPTFQEAKDYDL